MRTALIIGCDGQDGRIALEQLGARGYKVLGVSRHGAVASGLSWDKPVDIRDKKQVDELLKAIKPDEIYYLAAFHHSSQDQVPSEMELFNQSHDVHVHGLLNCLEAIREQGSSARLFYAASSLIFGSPEGEVQTEETPFAPDTVYGITKLNGLWACRYYRARYGVFASVGILYNHESPYRKENFLSKKITTAAVKILRHEQEILTIGDLNAETDWGYAPDYVEAMQRILRLEKPDNFIVATGQKHTVRDFVASTFDYLALDWQQYVREDHGIMTRKKKGLVGNPAKLKKLTGWQPSVDFKGMIKHLLQAQGVDV